MNSHVSFSRKKPLPTAHPNHTDSGTNTLKENYKNKSIVAQNSAVFASYQTYFAPVIHTQAAMVKLPDPPVMLSIVPKLP